MIAVRADTGDVLWERDTSANTGRLPARASRLVLSGDRVIAYGAQVLSVFAANVTRTQGQVVLRPPSCVEGILVVEDFVPRGENAVRLPECAAR